MPLPPRIYLSSPHMSGDEEPFVKDAFVSNWIAPLGPHVDAFQGEFSKEIGGTPSLALSSGTAALHLALQLMGVGRDDDVFVSTLTFSASVNPILYLGARPVFVDSDKKSWNMDPTLLEMSLAERASKGKLPKAIIVVHLYGQSADLDPILETCKRYNIKVIEDAAEALGASYKGRQPGTFGDAGIFSFNGNKIITTSGGGMLVSPDQGLIDHALKLATQSREPTPHYEHTEIGYNYRMSNVLAAIGRGQLRHLKARVDARRRNFAYYVRELNHLPGIHFMPEAPWGVHTRWLTTLTINPTLFGATRDDVRLALAAEQIEARPLWKPMHQQPVFASYEAIGGDISEELFQDGLCLPSGSNLAENDLARVVNVIRQTHQNGPNASTLHR